MHFISACNTGPSLRSELVKGRYNKPVPHNMWISVTGLNARERSFALITFPADSLQILTYILNRSCVIGMVTRLRPGRPRRRPILGWV